MHDDQDSLQIGDFAALVRLSIPQLRRYDRMQLEPEGRSIGMPGTGIGRGSERGEPRVLVKNLDGGAADCFDVCRPVASGGVIVNGMTTFVPSSRRVLFRIAEPRNGWFRAAEAVEAGVARQQLARFAASGVVQRSGHGVYRLCDFPATPFEDVIEACLWAGPDAAASNGTALAVHGLGDAMPAAVHLTVPRRFRKRRAGVVVHQAAVHRRDVTVRVGVPVTTVERTIRDLASDGESVETVVPLLAEAERMGVLSRRRALALRFEIVAAT